MRIFKFREPSAPVLKNTRRVLAVGSGVLLLGSLTLIEVALAPNPGRPYHPPIVGANLVENPGFEERNESTTTLRVWKAYGAGFVRDHIKRAGASSIRMTNNSFATKAGAIQRINLTQHEKKPVFIGAYVRGEHIALTPDAWVGASIYAEIVLVDGTVVYWNSIKNSGTFDWRWIGFNTAALPEVNQPIDHIFVIPAMVGATGTAWFDDITVREFEQTGGAVTLMFDDGFQSVWTIARPELEHYRFPGVLAAINTWVGRYGYVTKAELKKLEKNGWEIIAHTLSHVRLSTLRQEDIDRELGDSKRLFEAQGFAIRNHAFPFGDADALVIAKAAELYRSARTYVDGNNPAGTFPYGVQVRGITSSTTPAEVVHWLTAAKLEKEWVVIVFHDIQNKAPDPFDTTPQHFREIVAAVAESGLPVITYDDGVNRFTIPERMMHGNQ